MDGILSSFGFSSKKQPKKDEHEGGEPNVADIEQPYSPLQDGDFTQGSTDQSTNNRTSSMRLSKNSPAKPADNEFEIPDEPMVAPYSSNPVAVKSTPSQTQTPSAVIGPKITIKGELTGEEDLLIQGTVEGTIDLKGNQLIIGAQGTVRANLMAKIIIIEGTVEGDLIGQERIEIKASSNVKGNLIADRVTLEDGAQFRGSIDMDSKGSGTSGKYASSSASSHTAPSKTEVKSEKV